MKFRKTFSVILGIIAAAGLSVSAVGSTAAEPAVLTDGVTRLALSSPGDTYAKGGLLYTELDDGTYEVGYDYDYGKPGSSVKIPSTVNGKTVTRIAESGFYRCSDLEYITLPETVVSAGENAFTGTKLVSKQSGSTIRYAGHLAVECSTTATKASIKEGTLGLSDKLFALSPNIKEVELPDSLVNLGSNTFAGCTKLEDIDIPSGITEIKDGVFYGCKNLDPYFPKGLTSIGAYAFANSGLSDADMPNIEKIGKGAFENSGVSGNVEVGDGYIEIGARAFAGTSYYKSLGDVKYVGNICIGASSSVTSIELDEGTLGIADMAFTDCTKLKSITIPGSVKKIGTDAFFACENLTTVTIGEGLESIGEDAFRLCTRLSEISLPSSLEAVYEGAFYGCSKLTAVKYNGSILDWAEIAFGDDNETLFNAPIVFASDPKALDPVGELTVTKAGCDRVSFSWKPSEGARVYEIHQKNGSSWKKIDELSGDSTFYTVDNLSQNTDYTFRVTAKTGNFGTSAEITAHTLFQPMYNLKATAGEDNVVLSWDKNAGAAYYRVDMLSGEEWEEVFRTAKNTVLTCTIKELEPLTKYTFRVVGVNGELESEASEATAATTASTKPDAVTGVSGVPAETSIKLTWDKHANADRYQVDVYKAGALFKSVKTTALYYNFTGLTHETEYEFKVYAIKGAKTSLPAKTRITTLSSRPQKPENLAAAESMYSVKLTWDKAVKANKYRVDVFKNGKWVTVSSGTTALTYNVTGLAASTEYDFRVYALNGTIPSAEPAEITKTTLSDIPDTVKNLDAEPSMYSAKLTWEKSAIANKYRIDVLKNDKWTTVNAKCTALTYNVTGLAADSTYEIRVYSYYNNIMNPTPAEFTIKTLSDVPDTVEELAGDPAPYSVKLSWNKSAIANKYRIDVLKNDKWTTVNAKCTALTYNVTGLAANTEYQFRVYSYYNNIMNPTPATLTIKTPTDIPDAVENLEAVPDVYSVKLSWDKSKIADKYRIDVLKNGRWTTVNAKCTALSYNVTGLTANTPYEFRVYAMFGSKTSEMTEISAATLIPEAVENLSAVPDMYSVKLTWDKSALANKYRIDVLKNGKWVTVNAKCTALTYNVTGLSPLTKYEFRVYALNNNVSSEATEITATTLTDIPEPVTNITAEPDMYSVKLSWDKSDIANKYRVDVLKNGKWVTANTKITGTTYTVTGLTALTEYQFRVYALFNTKTSEFKEFSATTLTDIPEPVENLTAVPDMYSVKLTWDKSPKANKYRIDVLKNDKWVTVSSGCTALTYNVTGLTANTPYEFRVYALNGSKLSEKPTEIPAVTLTDIPEPVENITAEPDMYSVKLSWDKSAIANKYRVDVFKNGKWVTANAKITGTTYTVTGLTALTEYQFRVYALFNTKTSEFKEFSATTLTDVPEPVKNITAVPDMYSVKLTWDKVPKANKYRIDIWKNEKWVTLNAKCTALTYNVTGLSALTEYKFRIYALNNNIMSEAYEFSAKTLTDIPDAVENLTAVPDMYSVKLSWDKSPKANKYRIDVLKNGSWVTVNAKCTALYYTVTGLTADTEYEFRVYAINGTKMCEEPTEITEATLSDIPEAVTGLTAERAMYTIKLSWDKNKIADKYQIDVYKDGARIKSFKTTALYYNVTGLTALTDYDFRVYALYKNNISPEAAELTATTLTDIPDLVTNIAANNVDTTKFTLTWDKSAIADKYRVEMKVGETWKTLTTTTALSYNVTSLLPNTEYRFKVTAIRGTKYHEPEEFVMKTDSKQPSPVQELEAIAKAGSVKLLWEKSLLADSYQVEMWSNGVWVKIAKTTATSYNITGLSESMPYEFRVYAVNYVEYSTAETISVVTKKSLAPILDLSAQYGDYRLMMKGIDVSGWQGTIDFNAVKKSGVDFVIVKAGYGTSTVDTWETNYKNAKKAGLKVGAYWYSYATTLSQGKAEARAFVKAMNGKKLDFPVYFDLEESAQFNKGMTFCTNLVEAFCSEVEDEGYLAGVYCSRYWYTNFVSESTRLSRPTWIADYSRACDYGGSYGIWQYGTGYVDGIEGKCDLNWAYTDYSSFIKRNGLNGY